MRPVWVIQSHQYRSHKTKREFPFRKALCAYKDRVAGCLAGIRVMLCERCILVFSA